MTMQCPNCVFEVKNRSCLSDGLYCLIPPKEDINRDFNVDDEGMLLESLYGRCLHEVAKSSDTDLKTFFNYLYNVRQVCFKNQWFG